MDPLISAAQVVALAFKAPDFIREEAISEATILAAEQKFIRPVLGDPLCDALMAGKYPALLTDHVGPALALYTKLMMMPTLAVQTGTAGVVELNSRNLARATEAKTNAAIRRLRGDAGVLIVRAVKHIEANSKKYPEYDPAGNVMHRVSIAGGVALPTSGQR
jgi:hypothetical protein